MTFATKNIAIASAFAALALSVAPALAAVHHHHHRAVQSLNGLHMYAGESLDGADPVLGTSSMTETRAQAVHACSGQSSPYSNSSWQTAQFAVYSDCMTAHGQMP